MPLDELQKRVLAALLPLRSPASVFPGGSVLQRHGFRLSDDQDLFHASGTDIAAIVERDVEQLRSRRFSVEVNQPHFGMVDARVWLEELGATRIQWVAAGNWNFFAPVPDPDFGWRLHMADLATNKALAAAGRKQVRDYVDLAFIHRHVMPLWHVLLAAPGKDENLSPGSLAEKIAKSNGFRQDEIDGAVQALINVSAADIGQTVRAAIEEARDIFEELPDQMAGKLCVDEDGKVIEEVALILGGERAVRWLDAPIGGAWPSGPDIDSFLIRRVVDAFGWEGAKFSGRNN